jgi:putative transcriptional regulator
MKNNIRVERAIKDITQAQLAELVGVSRQTINSIETNRYVPSTILALKMARIFGKPLESIFILDEGD